MLLGNTNTNINTNINTYININSESKIDLLGVLHEEFKFIQLLAARKNETEKTPIASSMTAPKGNTKTKTNNYILILILKSQLDDLRNF